MRKLIVTEFVSLNGVMEAPGGEHGHPHSGWTFESIYGEDHYAYFADGKLGGAEGYQGGSTFKAFTLAAALEKGIPTSVSFDAPKFKDYTGEIFRSCEGPFRSTRFPVMNAGGGGEQILTDGWQDESPSWAPNGQFVMFNRFTRDGRSSLFAVPVGGGTARRLPTPQDGSDPSWSPLQR